MKIFCQLFFLILTTLFFSCSEEVNTPTNTNPDYPDVKIIYPQNNSTLPDNIIIEVEASDNKGIVKLEIYIDDSTNTERTFATPPFRYNWITSQMSDSTRHSIYAKGYDGDGNISSSPIVVVNILKFNAPSDLSVVSIDSNKAKIIWKDNSISEIGFAIERAELSGSFIEIGQVQSNITNYIDNTVEPKKEYQFRVRAFDSVKKTSYSDIIKISFNISEINLIKSLAVDGREITAIIFHPIQPALVTTTNNNLIHLINLPELSLSNSVVWDSMGGLVHCLDFSADGNYLIAGGGAPDHHLKIFNYNDFSILAQTPDIGGEIFNVKSINNMSTIIAAYSSGVISWDVDLNSGTPLTIDWAHTTLQNYTPNPFGVNKGETLIAKDINYELELGFLDTESGVVSFSYPSPFEFISHLDFHPTKEIVALVVRDSGYKVKLMNIGSGYIYPEAYGSSNLDMELKVFRTVNTLITASLDKNINFYDLDYNQLITSLTDNYFIPKCIALSYNEDYLAIGGTDHPDQNNAIIKLFGLKYGWIKL